MKVDKNIGHESVKYLTQWQETERHEREEERNEEVGRAAFVGSSEILECVFF